ncbi:Neuropeptide-Like Protein [Caenorhabditis elegans]|uniref:Neuropeptide-Like Protein n=1 Tax=Caenorhabditis elegans TaxID=6239 RepID=G4SP46_CAEEL|nr:Neuropeptide-Like Protein [Caenorhabditis elegans]CCD73142.2 Neuropeptide-Like Protein [Caenorhabditis elegans]
MLKSSIFSLLIVLLMVCSFGNVSANDPAARRFLQRQRRMDNLEFQPSGENTEDFFLRSAKWVSKMNPSGGALVSGRGGFRPGFVSRDWRHAMAEPNFVKRSYNDY